MLPGNQLGKAALVEAVDHLHPQGTAYAYQHIPLAQGAFVAHPGLVAVGLQGRGHEDGRAGTGALQRLHRPAEGGGQTAAIQRPIGKGQRPVGIIHHRVAGVVAVIGGDGDVDDIRHGCAAKAHAQLPGQREVAVHGVVPADGFAPGGDGLQQTAGLVAQHVVVGVGVGRLRQGNVGQVGFALVPVRAGGIAAGKIAAQRCPQLPGHQGTDPRYLIAGDAVAEACKGGQGSSSSASMKKDEPHSGCHGQRISLVARYKARSSRFVMMTLPRVLRADYSLKQGLFYHGGQPLSRVKWVRKSRYMHESHHFRMKCT